MYRGGRQQAIQAFTSPPKFRKLASEAFEPHKRTYLEIISAGHNRSEPPECGTFSELDAMDMRRRVENEVLSKVTNELTSPSAFQTPKELLDNGQGETYGGLQQPTMNITGTPVIGRARTLHRRENKQRRQALQATQPLDVSYWTCHKGDYNVGERTKRRQYRNEMCPANDALRHPAAEILQEYASFGCPARTG